MVFTPSTTKSYEIFTSIPVTKTKLPAITLSPTESVTTTPTSLPTGITDDFGVEMVLVPEGEFTMGADEKWWPNVNPAHKVYLNSYYIDKYEVTNMLYKTCADLGACEAPKESNSFTIPNYFGNTNYDNFPVIYVDWNMARTYCEWRGAYMSSEAQWEKAARGMGTGSYSLVYGCSYANFCDNDTKEVGSFENSKSPYGAYDMLGNVWEWVADWYSETYYQNSPPVNPLGPVLGNFRVMRGGSWIGTGAFTYAYNRRARDPEHYYNNVGFRCAKAVNP